MNRTRGFVNLNRFKSAKAIKKLGRVPYHKTEKRRRMPKVGEPRE